MTERKNIGWIKFVPSLNLPKERVSIAYDTHDERGIRYAYGYFQFYNGTCGCFWKDGNEQTKVVKAEDIKYWMPVPSLDVQEDPASEDFTKALAECINQAQCAVVDPMAHAEIWKDELIKLAKSEEPLSEDLGEAAENYASTDEVLPNGKVMIDFQAEKAFKAGAKWQKERISKQVLDATVHPSDGEIWVDCLFDLTPFKEDEEVKVIILKKDSHE